MARLEDLTRGAQVKGVRADGPVEIAREIQARLPQGAPDSLVPTVTENSRTLKFKTQGFEES